MTEEFSELDFIERALTDEKSDLEAFRICRQNFARLFSRKLVDTEQQDGFDIYSIKGEAPGDLGGSIKALEEKVKQKPETSKKLAAVKPLIIHLLILLPYIAFAILCIAAPEYLFSERSVFMWIIGFVFFIEMAALGVWLAKKLGHWWIFLIPFAIFTAVQTAIDGYIETLEPDKQITANLIVSAVIGFPLIILLLYTLYKLLFSDIKLALSKNSIERYWAELERERTSLESRCGVAYRRALKLRDMTEADGNEITREIENVYAPETAYDRETAFWKERAQMQALQEYFASLSDRAASAKPAVDVNPFED